MALRELALRRTADRVEGDVQAYRVDKSIGSVWKTAAALLTCVGPDPGAERVVRGAARLASQLNADWHAIYVETPGLQRLPAARRERILATLNLAQELGARTAVLANPDVAQSVIQYARSHNLSKIVIGRDPARRLWPWQRSSGQRLAQLAPDIDLVEIGRAEGAAQNGVAGVVAPAGRNGRRVERAAQGEAPALPMGHDRRGGGDTGVVSAGWRISTTPTSSRIFLLTVVLVAVRFGRGPAALAAVARRRIVRFLLRSAAFLLRGQRRSISADVRRYAGRRIDHRTVDRRLALSGAGRLASGGAGRRPVRNRA